MSSGPSERFPRSQRLKRRRLIRPLFDRGDAHTQSVARGCVRLLYRRVDRSLTGTDTWIQAGFAPGRQPTAVKRNRLRRLMRETWRRHRDLITKERITPAETLTVMVLYRARTADAWVSEDLVQAMRALSSALSAEGTSSGS